MFPELYRVAATDVSLQLSAHCQLFSALNRHELIPPGLQPPTSPSKVDDNIDLAARPKEMHPSSLLPNEYEELKDSKCSISFLWLHQRELR